LICYSSGFYDFLGLDSDAGNLCGKVVEMLLPSPSDLCWKVKFPPEQEWIEKTTHIAIANIWQRAHHVARSQLGDESLATEMIEIAIERAVCRLQAGAPASPEDVTRLLSRLFAQEVRRRRKANNRLVLVGSSEELSFGSAQSPHSPVDSAIDLEVIFHDMPPDVHFALLLRYGEYRWSEIAAVLGITEAAVRVRCKRALKRVCQRMKGEDCVT
jgi:DNA-directed RNA polymerase specialized sigma24 family protein